MAAAANCKQHPDGNELQVGHGESPPTGEEATPFARPVGVLDAEPLKTLRGGGERGAEILAHRIQLGEPFSAANGTRMTSSSATPTTRRLAAAPASNGRDLIAAVCIAAA